eukprot:1148254-Pelagomonas_calceolata.AAC.1
MALVLYLINHWDFSLHFLCNDVLFIKGLRKFKNLGGNGDWEGKFGVTSRFQAAANLEPVLQPADSTP